MLICTLWHLRQDVSGEFKFGILRVGNVGWCFPKKVPMPRHSTVRGKTLVAFTFGFFPRRIIKERRVGNCEKISTYRQFLCFSHAQLNSTCLDGWMDNRWGRKIYLVDTPSKTVGPSTREKGNEENASLLIVKVKSFGIEINMARWSKQKFVDIIYNCIACFSCRQQQSGIKKRRGSEPVSCLANKLFPLKPLKHPSFLKFLTIW